MWNMSVFEGSFSPYRLNRDLFTPQPRSPRSVSPFDARITGPYHVTVPGTAAEVFNAAPASRQTSWSRTNRGRGLRSLELHMPIARCLIGLHCLLATARAAELPLLVDDWNFFLPLAWHWGGGCAYSS
jgi:hypothetical protein